MATVTKTKTKTETTGTLSQFYLTCPECGTKGQINVNLDDMGLFYCASCEDSFSARFAMKVMREQLRRWTAALVWVSLADGVLTDTRWTDLAEGATTTPEGDNGEPV